MATQNNAAPSHKDPTNFVRNGKPRRAARGYSAPLVVDEAIRWLTDGARQGKPFFLAVWTHEPHLPIETDPRFQEPYARPRRGRPPAPRQRDAARPRLRPAHEGASTSRSWPTSTFVFFTSDNGPEGDGTEGPHPRQHRRASRAEAVDVRGRHPRTGDRPLAGADPAGHDRDVPVIGTDLFPTVLGICGVKLPADRVIDGADVLGVLTGAATAVVAAACRSTGG